MKTLIKNIRIDYSLRYMDDQIFIIDIYPDVVKLKNTYRYSVNGFLVGIHNQIMTNRIILNN